MNILYIDMYNYNTKFVDLLKSELLSHGEQLFQNKIAGAFGLVLVKHTEEFEEKDNILKLFPPYTHSKYNKFINSNIDINKLIDTNQKENDNNMVSNMKLIEDIIISMKVKPNRCTILPSSIYNSEQCKLFAKLVKTYSLTTFSIKLFVHSDSSGNIQIPNWSNEYFMNLSNIKIETHRETVQDLWHILLSLRAISANRIQYCKLKLTSYDIIDVSLTISSLNQTNEYNNIRFLSIVHAFENHQFDPSLIIGSSAVVQLHNKMSQQIFNQLKCYLISKQCGLILQSEHSNEKHIYALIVSENGIMSILPLATKESLILQHIETKLNETFSMNDANNINQKFSKTKLKRYNPINFTSKIAIQFSPIRSKRKLNNNK